MAEARFDGTYDRFECPWCGALFEVESPADRSDLACDACPWTGPGDDGH